MEGNQLLSAQSRVLLAAALFAAVASGVFALVWFWPQFVREEVVVVTTGEEEYTTEQKLAVLAQIRAADPEAMEIPTAEKAGAMERVSKPDSETGLTKEEKLQALQMLREQ